MWKLAPLALIITASACAVPSYTTRHGLKIYDNTTLHVPQDRVEAITEHALTVLGDPKGLRGVEVHFFDKLVAVPVSDETVIIADGFTDTVRGEVLVSAFSHCLEASSLAHELAHVMREQGGLAPDPFHRDTRYWARIDDLARLLEETRCTDSQRERERVARRTSAKQDAARQANRLMRPVMSP